MKMEFRQPVGRATLDTISEDEQVAELAYLTLRNDERLYEVESLAGKTVSTPNKSARVYSRRHFHSMCDLVTVEGSHEWFEALREYNQQFKKTMFDRWDA